MFSVKHTLVFWFMQRCSMSLFPVSFLVPVSSKSSQSCRSGTSLATLTHQWRAFSRFPQIVLRIVWFPALVRYPTSPGSPGWSGKRGPSVTQARLVPISTHQLYIVWVPATPRPRSLGRGVAAMHVVYAFGPNIHYCVLENISARVSLEIIVSLWSGPIHPSSLIKIVKQDM